MFFFFKTGPPGSGKSYLAKLIRDREAEYGGTVRIMSIDDYFMQEGEVEERDPVTGKMVRLIECKILQIICFLKPLQMQNIASIVTTGQLYSLEKCKPHK